jgi:hypothetical protein
LYVVLFSPIHAKRPTHFILLVLISLLILGEEYKLCHSSLCSFLHPPITSSLFGANVFLGTLFTPKHIKKLQLSLCVMN